MKNFMFDSTGDIVLTQNGPVMIDGPAEMMQRIWFTMTTNLGEWVLNPESGFDRMEILGRKLLNDNEVVDLVTEAITQVEGVESIEEISVTRRGRGVDIKFVVIDEGAQRITGEVSI